MRALRITAVLAWVVVLMAILLDATFDSDTEGFSAGARSANEGADFDGGFLQVDGGDDAEVSFTAVSSGVGRVDVWVRITDDSQGAANTNSFIYLLPTGASIDPAASVATLRLDRQGADNARNAHIDIRGSSTFEHAYIISRDEWHKYSFVVDWSAETVDVYVNDVLVVVDQAFPDGSAADVSRIVLSGEASAPTTDFDEVRVESDWSAPSEGLLLEDDFTTGSGAIEESTPSTDIVNANAQPWKSPDNTSSYGKFTRGASGLTGSDTLGTVALARTGPEGVWTTRWQLGTGNGKYMALVIRSWEGMPSNGPSVWFRYWQGSSFDVAVFSDNSTIASSSSPAGVTISDSGTYTLKIEARGNFIWCYIVEDDDTEHLQFGGPINLRGSGDRGLLSQDYAGPVLDATLSGVDSANKPLDFSYTGRSPDHKTEKTIGEWTAVIEPGSVKELYSSGVSLDTRNLLYDRGFQLGHMEEHDAGEDYATRQQSIYNTTNALVLRQRSVAMKESQAIGQVNLYITFLRRGFWIANNVHAKSGNWSAPHDIDFRGELWSEDFRRVGASGSSAADAEGGFHGIVNHQSGSLPLAVQSVTDPASGDVVRLTYLGLNNQNATGSHQIQTSHRGAGDPLTRKIWLGTITADVVYEWATLFFLERGALSLSDAVIAGVRDDFASPSISVTTGTLNTAIDGDIDTDGFNERFGWYEVDTDGSGGAAFTLATSTTRYYPVIRLRDYTAGGTVTADGSPLTAGTDYVLDDLGDGHALLQILSVVSAETDYVYDAGGPITPDPADAGADTFLDLAITRTPAPADAGTDTVGPAVPPATPSVTNVTGDPDALVITGSSYESPVGTPQQFARWQVVVDGGDPDDPADVLYDSGYSDTDFESHTAEETGIGFGVDVDAYVTHVDTNDLEVRSGPFDHTMTTTGKLGGMLIQFVESDGATVVESYTEHTDQTTYQELLRENLLRPSGSKYLQILPHKIGTEAKAATIQRVSADRGAMAIAHHARPYMPDLDDFHVHGAVSASSTIDWSRGHFQTIDLDANLVATHLNARVGQELELLLTQDATGGRTIDLGATGEPTYSTAANAIDYVRIRKTGTSTYIVVAEKLGIS